MILSTWSVICYMAQGGTSMILNFQRSLARGGRFCWRGIAWTMIRQFVLHTCPLNQMMPLGSKRRKLICLM